MGQLLDPIGAAVLVKVVETGGFRGAARVLGMPKSSVSRHVAELEAHLGARLLQRTTRRVGLTDAGKAYFDRAQAALLGLEEAERAATDLQAAPQGTLRLSAPVNFGLLLLPELLAAFLHAHPRVRVEVEISDRHVDLIEERFDVAIRAGALRDSTLVAHRLSTAKAILVASPAYLRARKHPKVPADLAEHSCLVYGNAETATWQFLDDGKPVSVEVRGPLSANNFFVLCESAAAGLGIARLPNLVPARALAEKRLTTVLDAFAPPDMPLQIIYPSARHLSAKVRAFVDFMRERLAGKAL